MSSTEAFSGGDFEESPEVLALGRTVDDIMQSEHDTVLQENGLRQLISKERERREIQGILDRQSAFENIKLSLGAITVGGGVYVAREMETIDLGVKAFILLNVVVATGAAGVAGYYRGKAVYRRWLKPYRPEENSSESS